MNKRLSRLRNKLPQYGLEGILISQAENCRYLSGFTGTAFLFISARDAILATDFRFLEQAERLALPMEGQAPGWQTVLIKGDFADWFPRLASGLKVQRLGFESQGLSFASYQELTAAVARMPSDARPELIPSQGLVESLRAIKEAEELGLIERAAALADAALEQVVPTVQPGMTEREIAWRMERFLRDNGSDPIPFEAIVASGPNSALPHAQPTDRRLQTGEPLLIDIGARVDGYCSNISRTFCLDAPEQRLSQIYHVVLEAQLTALKAIEVGMRGDQADHFARVVIEQAGYGDAFGHGLGHGIGLAAHEQPGLGPRSSAILSQGMVFTIEPGIYIKGWGGVRIEDMVVLEEGKARILTKAKKALRR
jgi:Xaa-Pro aminopeptidase